MRSSTLRGSSFFLTSTTSTSFFQSLGAERLLIQSTIDQARVLRLKTTLRRRERRREHTRNVPKTQMTNHPKLKRKFGVIGSGMKPKTKIKMRMREGCGPKVMYSFSLRGEYLQNRTSIQIKKSSQLRFFDLQNFTLPVLYCRWGYSSGRWDRDSMGPDSGPLPVFPDPPEAREGGPDPPYSKF